LGGSMSQFRAIVHYHFKKGHEEEGIKYLEEHLTKEISRHGGHHIEIFRDESQHGNVIGIAEWNNVDEAKKFQKYFSAIENEMSRFLSDKPSHHFYKLHWQHMPKIKKAA